MVATGARIGFKIDDDTSATEYITLNSSGRVFMLFLTLLKIILYLVEVDETNAGGCKLVYTTPYPDTELRVGGRLDNPTLVITNNKLSGANIDNSVVIDFNNYTADVLCSPDKVNFEISNPNNIAVDVDYSVEDGITPSSSSIQVPAATTDSNGIVTPGKVTVDITQILMPTIYI